MRNPGFMREAAVWAVQGISKGGDSVEYFIKDQRGGLFCMTCGVEQEAVPIGKSGDFAGNMQFEVLLNAVWQMAQGPWVSIEQICLRDGERMGVGLRLITVVHCCGRTSGAAGMAAAGAAKMICGNYLRQGYQTRYLPVSELRRLLQFRDTAGVRLEKKPVFAGGGLEGAEEYVWDVVGGFEELGDLYRLLAEQPGNCMSIQYIPVLLPEEDRDYLLTAWELHKSMAGDLFGGTAGKRDAQEDRAAGNLEYYVRAMDRSLFRIHIVLNGPSAAQLSASAAAALRMPGGEVVSSFSRGLYSYGAQSSVSFFPWDVDRYELNLGKSGSPWLISTCTGEEGGRIALKPREDGNGIPFRGNPFSLFPLNGPEPAMTDSAGIYLGRAFDGANVFLPPGVLTQNCNVFGAPGYGKTTLIINMILELRKRGVDVMVLECAKNEFRGLLDLAPEAKLFHVENAGIELKLNPFLPPAGIELSRYLPCLREAFAAAFVLEPPLDSLVERALSQAYSGFGWKMDSKAGDRDAEPFGMAEFVDVLKKVIRASRYEGKLKGNLETAGEIRLLRLLEMCGTAFDTVSATPAEELLSGLSIVNLTNVLGEERCTVAALLLIRLLAAVRSGFRSSKTLRNVIVLDEAHAFMDLESNHPSGKMMVNLLETMAAEMRGLGIGLIVADQLPSRVGRRIIACSSTNICMHLGSLEEAALMRGQMDLDERGLQGLMRLEKGQMVVTTPGQGIPLPVYAWNFRDSKKMRDFIPDEEVDRRFAAYRRAHARELLPYLECAECPEACKGCDRFTRERAAYYGAAIYKEKPDQIRDAASLYRELVKIPAYCKEQGFTETGALCYCTAAALVRQISRSYGIRLPLKVAVPMICHALKEGGAVCE